LHLAPISFRFSSRKSVRAMTCSPAGRWIDRHKLTAKAIVRHFLVESCERRRFDEVRCTPTGRIRSRRTVLVTGPRTPAAARTASARCSAAGHTPMGAACAMHGESVSARGRVPPCEPDPPARRPDRARMARSRRRAIDHPARPEAESQKTPRQDGPDAQHSFYRDIRPAVYGGQWIERHRRSNARRTFKIKTGRRSGCAPQVAQHVQGDGSVGSTQTTFAPPPRDRTRRSQGREV
jgi:hypothetical protein